MKIFKNASGLIDWIMQRFTALFFLSYTAYIFSCLYPDWSSIDYDKWKIFFSDNTVKISTIFAFTFILKHALIGVRTVLQDYVHNKKVQRAILLLSSAFSTSYILYTICILFGKNI